MSMDCRVSIGLVMENARRPSTETHRSAQRFSKLRSIIIQNIVPDIASVGVSVAADMCGVV